jgi:hypothetical protein
VYGIKKLKKANKGCRAVNDAATAVADNNNKVK